MSAQVYRLVVSGELGPRYASAFEGMTISTGGGKTEITGTIVDQSHLHGLLERIGGLGLTLCSLAQVDTDNSEPGTRRAPATSS